MTKKYRDGLFRDYFSDKRRLLGLCNLLTGENATDPDEIVINTLDGVFFGRLKNDISCLFRGKLLVIIEQQSTVNENMPLRMLLYASELLKQYVDDCKQKIYLEQLIPLPAPKFFVFYNGKRKEASRREMRLSDAFAMPTTLELVVTLYNINAGMNDDFVSSDAELNNYCTFVNIVEKYKAAGIDGDHALKAAFDYCVANNIMAEYLLARKKELASMLGLEYDAELEKQAWIEFGKEEGLAEGLAKGRAENKLEMVENLLKVGTPLEYIVAATGWSEEQILNLAKN